MKFQTTLATALLASVANSASVRRQDAAALAATAGYVHSLTSPFVPHPRHHNMRGRAVD